VGGVSLVESEFGTRIPFCLLTRGNGGRFWGVSKPSRGLPHNLHLNRFGSSGSTILNLIPLQTSAFALHQVRVGLTGLPVQLGAGSPENFV